MANTSLLFPVPDTTILATEAATVHQSISPTVQVIYPPAATTFGLLTAIVLIVVGVAGNGFTIAALVVHKKLRTCPTSVFIVSLCVTDLIFCSFNLPITAVRFWFQEWVLGGTLCRLFPMFFYLNVAASLFTMTAVTVNRYVLVCHYTSYDRVYRPLNIAGMLLLCWLFPLALLLPTLFEVWGRFGLSEPTFSCTVLRDEAGRSPKKLFFLVGFFLPCLVIVGCYTRIFCMVRASRRQMAAYTGNRRGRDEMTLTRMVLSIFAAFIVCYLPLMAVNVFDDKDSFPTVHVIASALAWSASVINPIIYGLVSTRYRQAYRSLLPSCCVRLLLTAGGKRTGKNTISTPSSTTENNNNLTTSHVMVTSVHLTNGLATTTAALSESVHHQPDNSNVTNETFQL